MQFISMLGMIIGALVLVLGLRLSSQNLNMFIDATSAFIVLGGTFAASTITFRIDRMFVLFKIFIRHITGANKVNHASLIEEIIKIVEAYRKGEPMEAHIPKINDHFFKESLELIQDGILQNDEIVELLEERNDQLTYIRLEEANRIKILGQFPPAFGMMGTTIGMIVLLSNLGGKDAIKIIGPAMSVCLITTLYGVILANLGFIPVAENLIDNAKEESRRKEIIIEGVRLMLEKTNPIIVAEKLNSFLQPSERLDWKEVLGK